ncbi:MAG: hypothetical protein NUW22_16200, partial [Acidobacteria bacterium]|nr:hypothetical protein [Acidobacteriota bacterium]
RRSVAHTRVSLVPPYIYVYGPVGDKRRIVQFDATGPFSPTSRSPRRSLGAGDENTPASTLTDERDP